MPGVRVTIWFTCFLSRASIQNSTGYRFLYLKVDINFQIFPQALKLTSLGIWMGRCLNFFFNTILSTLLRYSPSGSARQRRGYLTGRSSVGPAHSRLPHSFGADRLHTDARTDRGRLLTIIGGLSARLYGVDAPTAA